MSYNTDESSDRLLFSQYQDQPTSPEFYRERSHFRALLRKLVVPTFILVIPIVLVICLEHINSIFWNWVNSGHSYVSGQFQYAHGRFNDWVSSFGDLSWLGTLIQTVWIIVILGLYFKACYDWVHEYRTISREYVIDAEKKLFTEETSSTIETSIVVGVSVRRTLFDKLFPKCGTVKVKTKDLEGNEKSIQFQDVVDPYRMRDVILHVRQIIKSEDR